MRIEKRRVCWILFQVFSYFILFTMLLSSALCLYVTKNPKHFTQITNMIYLNHSFFVTVLSCTYCDKMKIILMTNIRTIKKFLQNSRLFIDHRRNQNKNCLQNWVTFNVYHTNPEFVLMHTDALSIIANKNWSNRISKFSLQQRHGDIVKFENKKKMFWLF